MNNIFWKTVNLSLLVVSLAYPVLWLWRKTPSILTALPLVMALLWGIKACSKTAANQRYFSCFMAALLFIVWLTHSFHVMYWYPVLMNLIMLALFGGSLFTKQSLVERMARLQTPHLTVVGIDYTRKVTEIWCAVFLLNGLITATAILIEDYHFWALYSGIIAYIVMAAVMVVEWLIRQRVKATHHL